MTAKLLHLRTFVSRSGYRWAKVDRSGHAEWVEGEFRIPKAVERSAQGDRFSGKRRVRAGHYLCADQPYFSLSRASPSAEVHSNDLREHFEAEKDIEADAPALFREFADLPSAPEAIKGFANQWGHLSKLDELSMISVRASDTLARQHPSVKRVGVMGEAMSTWVAEIRMISEAVSLWEAIKDGDKSAMLDILHRRESELEKRWPTKTKRNDDHGSQQRAPLEYARRQLMDVVNARLQHTFSPQLTIATTGDSASNTGGWKFYLEPECLVDALWFQLAEAIRGNIDFRPCPVCGRWLEIATESGRRNKVYCSNVCQMRAYRKRRKTKHGKHSGTTVS